MEWKPPNLNLKIGAPRIIAPPKKLSTSSQYIMSDEDIFRQFLARKPCPGLSQKWVQIIVEENEITDFECFMLLNEQILSEIIKPAGPRLQVMKSLANLSIHRKRASQDVDEVLSTSLYIPTLGGGGDPAPPQWHCQHVTGGQVARLSQPCWLQIEYNSLKTLGESCIAEREVRFFKHYTRAHTHARNTHTHTHTHTHAHTRTHAHAHKHVQLYTFH